MVSGTQFDLADNDLIVDYDVASPAGTWNGSNSYTGLTGLIAAGRQQLGWNGNGIVSSAARVNSSVTTLGVAEASDALQLGLGQSGVFSGETVDSTAILIKYTYLGDLNLDGRDNIDDYGIIDGAIGRGFTGYYHGDVNYDGKIDIDDMATLDVTIAMQGVPL